MSEIKEVGVRSLDEDLAVAADVAVVGPLARDAEDGPRLLGPIHEVGGLKDGHPLPPVDEHPIIVPPPKNGWAFLGLAGDDETLDRPLVEVLAVGGVDVRAVGLVLVPHPPAARRL